MKKTIFLPLILASSLLLAGCPSFDVGGWIESVDAEGNNTKATFGGNFTCEVVENYYEDDDAIVALGRFQYHDHNYQITWNNRDRDLSFHGKSKFIWRVGDAELNDCEDLDELFIEYLGEPEGYCGNAALQPAPKKEGDFGYGVSVWYRIALTDEPDVIEVWLGFGFCPNPTVPSTYEYHNVGTLGGGEVTPRYPLVD